MLVDNLLVAQNTLVPGIIDHATRVLRNRGVYGPLEPELIAAALFLESSAPDSSFRTMSCRKAAHAILRVQGHFEGGILNNP